MIDIIIPVYNAGNLLYRCVDSLLNQTDKKDYKIYLIDDGSTDISSKICDEYAIKYENTHVFHKKNGGGVDARQYGINCSNGEYIVFVDADDFVERNYIANLKKALINSADYYILNNKRNYITKKGYYVEKNFLQDKYISLEQTYIWMLSSMINAVWDKIYVRKIIKENNIQFKTKITHGDDFYINMTYLQSVNKVYCQNTFSYVHIIDSPVSVCKHDVSINRLYDIKLLYDTTINLIPKYIDKTVMEKFKKSILDTYFVSVGLMVRQGKTSKELNEFFLNESLPQINIDLINSKKERLRYWILTHRKYRLAGIFSYICNMSMYLRILDKRYEKQNMLIKGRKIK